MGHIFISYSHKDKAYVHKLQDALLNEGFSVWIDDHIDYGTVWPQIIQENLDDCDAFIVVMTENAYESKWVQNEVARAQRKKKPFFALLLRGDTWLSFEAIQYEDVTSERLPNKKFYENLELVTPRHKTAQKEAEQNSKQKSVQVQKYTTPEKIEEIQNVILEKTKNIRANREINAYRFNYKVIFLAIITASLHIAPAFLNYQSLDVVGQLFTSIGYGYLILLGTYSLASIFLKQIRNTVRIIFIFYIGLVIVLWIAAPIGNNIFAKISELVLLFFLATDT